MNFAVVGGVLIVVVVVAGGLLVYRSTAPDGDVVPDGASSLEEDAGESAPSQFLQLEPESGPPGSDEAVVESPAVDVVTSPSPAAGAAIEDTGEVAHISMTDTGFSPASLTVSVGGTVTFTNDGQALHWPASDVHPTHNELPGFDSERGIPTGGTYSYTFTTAGSWDFHDHLNPQYTGTVIVE